MKSKVKVTKMAVGKNEMMTIGDLPRDFMEETGHTLADYSVALGFSENGNPTEMLPIGSGVLVRKGNCQGILTAHHCIHKPGRDLQVGHTAGDTVLLLLKRRQPMKIPPEVLVKHALAVPKTDDFGPDLAFLEILPCPQLGSLQAACSFWNLDKDPTKIAKGFGIVGTPFAVIGFPEVFSQKSVEGLVTRFKMKHMTFYYSIVADGLPARECWDYVEANCLHDEKSDLPKTFAGVSGGPVWGLKIKRDKKTGKFSLLDFALIGIAFFQTGIKNEEQRIRAHFIKSIYRACWKKLK
jgi:hypothetical protein